MKSNCLHLASPAGDLEKAKIFYCEVLGCKTGNSEEGAPNGNVLEMKPMVNPEFMFR